LSVAQWVVATNDYWNDDLPLSEDFRMAFCVSFITDGWDVKCGHTVVILMYADGCECP